MGIKNIQAKMIGKSFFYIAVNKKHCASVFFFFCKMHKPIFAIFCTKCMQKHFH